MITETTIAAIVSAGIAGLVAWLTSRRASRSTREVAEIQSATDLVPELVRRVEALEEQVRQLTGALTQAQADLAEKTGVVSEFGWFVDQLGMLHMAAWKGPIPRVPRRIRPHIDPDLWLVPDPIEDLDPPS